jgi:hypothetical protein
MTVTCVGARARCGSSRNLAVESFDRYRFELWTSAATRVRAAATDSTTDKVRGSYLKLAIGSGGVAANLV